MTNPGHITTAADEARRKVDSTDAATAAQRETAHEIIDTTEHRAQDANRDLAGVVGRAQDAASEAITATRREFRERPTRAWAVTSGVITVLLLISAARARAAARERRSLKARSKARARKSLKALAKTGAVAGVATKLRRR